MKLEKLDALQIIKEPGDCWRVYCPLRDFLMWIAIAVLLSLMVAHSLLPEYCV